ncbi:hypothetical protein V495_06082 [Pseudogymnoascus sp. VKM F-4514 (FW-929)]|nr:hypothetical protein V495_06082 [Pseudogymnoascus sp. VKM F-4514 (FW-929)]KFY58342.1 hypothetical protein V497_04892 [Pseudogymnoascus sp. VKM F-4516 (FW-969)]
MSGVEALALIGIIASTLQLASFSSQVLRRIKDYKDDTTTLPKEFWTLQDQLPLISHALHITYKQTQSDELAEEACKALIPVIKGCHQEVLKLKTILEKVAPSVGETGWKRNWKALTSVFHDKDVTAVAAGLAQSLAVINNYHGAYTAATTGSILQKLTAMAEVPQKVEVKVEVPVQHFIAPTVWTDDFAGRKDTIKSLEQLLAAEDKHRRVSVIGLGGVGKTRLLLQYAYRFKGSDTHSVFWIHASSMSRMNKTCAEIARLVKIKGWENPMSNKIELVKDYLESPMSGKWTLLLDNADDYDLFYGSGKLSTLIPRSDNGAILMSTRDGRVGMEFAKGNSISLGALSLEESITLLDTRLGVEDNTFNDLKELSEELCGIPLALVQASSFIKQNFLSIPSYLEIYRSSDKDKIELLSEDFDDDYRDDEIRNPIATTWSLSFEYIQKRDPLAADILSVMSMLDPQAIPESLIYNEKSNLKFSKAMGTLQAFSLITARVDGLVWEGRREKSFDLHRLVRLAMRSWLAHHGRLELYTAKALGIMAERFVHSDWDTRAKWGAYLPHAAVLFQSDHLKHIEDAKDMKVSHDQNQKSGAASLEEAEKAYTLRLRFLGEDHPDTLETLDLIAKAAKDLYLFPKAIDACYRAIKGKTDTLGPDDPSTLKSMAYLGIVYRPMEKLQEAKEIGTHVLERRRAVLGNEHPDTLISMSYAATACRALGDYEIAAKLEAEKLKGWSKLYGPSHPQSLDALALVGWAYACQGKYVEADKLMGHSLAVQIDTRPTHWFTFWTMHSYSVLLGMQGKYFEAEELSEQALDLRTQYIGLSHPYRYVSLLYLAWIYNETGRYGEAETIELEVLDFNQKFYEGDTHHDVLLTRSQLASTYSYMSRHSEAYDIKSAVYETRLKTKGETHPATLRCKSSLGATLTSLSRLFEAETLLTSARDLQQTILGAEHPETLTTLSRLATLYERRGKHNEAAGLFLDVFEASERVLGEKHPRTRARAKDLERSESARLSLEAGVASTSGGKGVVKALEKGQEGTQKMPTKLVTRFKGEVTSFAVGGGEFEERLGGWTA